MSAQLSLVTRLIVFSILFVIYEFIITPILLYYTYKYYSFRSKIYISKRYPKAVLLMSIAGILEISIQKILYLAWSADFEFLSTTINTVMLIVDVLLWSMFFIPLLCALLVRYWLLFFQINLLKACMNNQWKLHLNNHNTQILKNSNWFLKNRLKYGSVKFGVKLFVILTLFVSILLTFLWLFATVYNINNTELVRIYVVMYSLIQFILITVLPFVVIFVLWFKVNSETYITIENNAFLNEYAPDC